MRRFQNLLFDLDGTLIDHFEVIYRAYLHVQERLGLPLASFETVLRAVGGSIPVTLGRLIGEDRVEEALPIWREYFNAIMLEKIEVLPGVEEALAQFASEGYRMAVFTNKDGPAARRIIEHLNWTDYFERVVGATDTPWRKPERAFSEWMLRELDADPKETLMVGDSTFDIEAGKVGGMTVYAVATGSHRAEELREAAADDVFGDFFELARRIRGNP
ncbi:MAG: HAD family hydrolase [Puniceicoccaceae bacterium]